MIDKGAELPYVYSCRDHNIFLCERENKNQKKELLLKQREGRTDVMLTGFPDESQSILRKKSRIKVIYHKVINTHIRGSGGLG